MPLIWKCIYMFHNQNNSMRYCEYRGIESINAFLPGYKKEIKVMQTYLLITKKRLYMYGFIKSISSCTLLNNLCIFI